VAAAYAQSLTWLNVSNNAVTSLDGLEALENLTMVRSIESLSGSFFLFLVFSRFAALHNKGGLHGD
jgi:hypothetical protein